MKPKNEKPITTAELFDKICAILTEQGQMPTDILDYGIAEYNPVPITTYEFSIHNNLDYGGNEGIYLNLWIERTDDGQTRRCHVGTFKTLLETPEAMRTMAQLLADFIVAERKYVGSNLDAFTWEGADVHPVDENGNKLSWGYSCSTMEAAVKKKDELLQKYNSVVIRDNETRKETIFGKEGVAQ
jgi:hypothetical protein